MLIRLVDTTPLNAGAKAATLGRLAKAGFPVPPAFVVPIDTYQSIVGPLDIPTFLSQHGPDEVRRLIEAQPLPPELITELTNALGSLGDPPVAVRSSATTEDTPHASAAGQHDTYLAIHGPSAVATKLLATWSSLWSPRATTYRHTLPAPTASPVPSSPPVPASPPVHTGTTASAGPQVCASPAAPRPFPVAPGIASRAGSPSPALAVLIQRHVDADVAGVLFTASPSNTSDSSAGEVSVIEASWGLGESVVQGLVTPDEYVVGADGVLEVRLGDKSTRIDRSPEGTVTTEVPDEARRRACLSDLQVERLRKLGQDVAEYLGGPQDIEFAVEGNQIWLLQARPVTARLAMIRPEGAGEEPRRRTGHTRAGRPGSQVSPEAGTSDLVLQGTAGSAGTAAGPARIVNGPEDFEKVAVGDILVCRFTDPAWTVLFAAIAGVVTETGGRLSHAAIVARERRIPAVLGVSSILTKVQNGQTLTIDGTTGTVRSPPATTVD